MKHSCRLAIGLMFCLVAGAAAPTTKKSPTLGDGVVAFAKAHLGKQVGNGQCAVLAGKALESVNARRRFKDHPDDEDYVWGDLVVVITGSPKGATFADGKPADIRPGDVLQYRDARFSGKKGRGTYTSGADHHTSVIKSTARNGLTINVYESNVNGRMTVGEATMNLSDMRSGWLRVYRAVRKDGSRED